MASIYKRDGSRNYFIQWFDHTGTRRRKSSGTSDKQAAQRIANKWESDVALRRERVIDPAIEDQDKIASLPLSKLLDAYGSAMASKSKQGHIDDTRIAIEKFGFETLKHITADRVNKYAADLRKAGRAARTIASHLQSIKGFTRWAVKNGKLASDPLATVSKPSVEDDRRLVRRFLSHDEWQWLDTTTRNSPEQFGMAGMTRALLYATAIQTGLRSSELRSLTRGKLSLTDAVPFVVAKPGGTKNKKLARQYVLPELAMELQHFVGRKLAGATVFPMPKEHDVADMLRADMAAARLAWLNTFQEPQERIERDTSDFLRSIDSEGERLDFHSLRHTCASWLIQRGADVKTVQTIMRHSDIRLTVDRYGHLFPGSEAAAIERIRGMFNQRSELRKTGTSTLEHLWQQSGCDSVRARGETVPLATPNHHKDANEKTPRFPENDEEKAGFSDERLRWELNPRWRICNPLP
jgi:site-specific recombinase XerD